MASFGFHDKPRPLMRELKWSPAEKAIARKAFNKALQQELAAVMEEAKQRAAKIKQPTDLWDLEDYLTERRQEIDRQFDYRYSILPLVFGQLILQKRLSLGDLHGLADDKLAYVRSYVALSSS
jgi:Photoprotection regulator fluorescence recovery protein